MHVADIMSDHVTTVDMDTSLARVRDIFESSTFHHLVVVEEGKVVGVVSDRDLLKNMSPFVGKMSERSIDRSALNRRVHQIMTRSLITASPTDELADAGRQMLANRVSCLPVVDEIERCVGIVTIRDIAAWAVNELESRGGMAA